MEKLKATGIDLVAVVTMDTPYPVQAWAEQLGLGQDFLFLSDVQGQLAKSLGTMFQAGEFGLRPKRCCAACSCCLFASWWAVSFIQECRIRTVAWS